MDPECDDDQQNACVVQGEEQTPETQVLEVGFSAEDGGEVDHEAGGDDAREDERNEGSFGGFFWWEVVGDDREQDVVISEA